MVKPLLLAKICAIIHNYASSSEKVKPLLSSHIKIQRHICLRTVLEIFCLICAYFSPDSDNTTFSFCTKCNIMDTKFSNKSNGLNLKTFYGFVYYKHTDFCIVVIFVSTVWILILTAPIHCRGSFDEEVM